MQIRLNAEWLVEHPQAQGRSYGHQIVQARGGRLHGSEAMELPLEQRPYFSFRALLFNLHPDLRDSLKRRLDRVDERATAFSWQRSDRRVARYLKAGDDIPQEELIRRMQEDRATAGR